MDLSSDLRKPSTVRWRRRRPQKHSRARAQSGQPADISVMSAPVCMPPHGAERLRRRNVRRANRTQNVHKAHICSAAAARRDKVGAESRRRPFVSRLIGDTTTNRDIRVHLLHYFQFNTGTLSIHATLSGKRLAGGSRSCRCTDHRSTQRCGAVRSGSARTGSARPSTSEQSQTGQTHKTNELR